MQVYEYTEQQRKIQGQVAGSTIRFGKVMTPHSFPLRPCSMHYEWDKDLEDSSLLRLNYEAPRKHAKTTFMARTYPLKTVLTSAAMGKREYILLIGKTQRSVAAKSLYQIKFELTYNDRIREVYGDFSKATAKEWGKFGIILANGTIVESLGLTQPISGLNLLDLRPTIIILDDVQDIHNTKTEEIMAQHIRWLLGEVEPALDDDGRIINIATPKHELAIVERLKDNPEWLTRQYDAVVREATEDKPGLSLWPEKMSYELLMQRERSAGSLNALREYYREYRCQLVGSEEQLFRPEYFRYYRGNLQYDTFGNPHIKITHLWREGENPYMLATPELRPVATFTGCDPASSQAEGSSYSTIVTIAVDAELNMFVLPYFRKRVSPSALKDELVKRNMEYRPSWTTIESNGYQVALRDQLRNLDGIFIPGLHLKHITRVSKDTRHERLEPYFYQGRMHMQEGMGELKTELLLYPRGKRDLLDGLEFATTRFHAPSFTVPVKEPSTKRERLGLAIGTDNWMGVV